MKEPALVLDFDASWEFGSSRPLPIEPYRTGAVAVRNPGFLEENPEVKNKLEERSWRASYIPPHLLGGNSSLMRLARRLWEEEDYASASIIASLTLPVSVLDKIVRRVQRDLAAIQLGPDRDMVKAVLDQIGRPECLGLLQDIAAQRPVMICDPFGGVGVLAYAAAHYLLPRLNGNFQIFIIDLNQDTVEIGNPLLKAFYKKNYPELSRRVTHRSGNGLTLSAEGLPEQFDLIIGSQAWHEFSFHDLRHHISLCHQRLTPGGRMIVADTTREPGILKKAGRMLPVLNKIGLGVSSLQYAVKNKPDRHFLSLAHSALREGRWLKESGFRSYSSGLLREEAAGLAAENGFHDGLIEARSVPPIGYLLASLRKSS